MGWKDTIQPIQQAPNQSTGSWRDTIAPINDTNPWAEQGKSVKSALTGVADMATLGFGPELSGAIGAPIGALKKAGTYVGYKPNENDVDIADYEDYKNSQKAEMQKSLKDAPYSGLVGKLAGGLLLAPEAGAGLLKNALSFGGQGAAYAVGSNEQNGSLKKVATDAALGGAGGVVSAGIGQLAQKAIPTAVGSGKLALKKIADFIRLPPKAKQAIGQEGMDAVARTLLDEGGVSAGMNAAEAEPVIEGLLNKAGTEKGAMVDAATKKIDPMNIINRAQKEIITPLKTSGTDVGISAAAPIEKEVAALKNRYAPDTTPDIPASPSLPSKPGNGGLTAPIEGNAGQEAVPGFSNYMTPSEAEAAKMKIQDSINYIQDPKLRQQAQRDYARILKESVEEAVDNPEFIPLKQKYGNLATALAGTGRTAALTDSGNGLIGAMHDSAFGHAAANAIVHGEPTTAATIAATRALTKGRVNSTVGVTADKISQFLQKYPMLDKVMQGLETGVSKGTPVMTRGLLNNFTSGQKNQ